MDNPTGAPRVVVLDVNETLSDLSPLDDAFTEIGLAAHERQAWFAGVLRDGFGLGLAGASAPFAEIASGALRARLQERGAASEDEVEAAVATVMGRFSELGLHRDVAPGIRALRAAGLRVVTLSNGAAGVAEALLARGGLRDHVDLVLSVEDAPAWKPAASAYQHALDECGVEAHEAMLVAVHPWDIDGAARAGLRTGWVDRSGRGAYPSYLRAPELTAPSLAELAGDLLTAELK
ncbi:(S)-2-haloacid dehalogenase 4A [Nocardioides dokdonensis FR1436]|uniref:(S)-2-haloacid dehalogenase 4A n=1 Tax=Nocardioides dokdonensis FR1436 TaxID=1300347 RepID=A0A1A9GJJ2_9ACTN|nr:haloacid dehalogenase type II [Nocardioides dokdonensis]ANH38459.1 (S)-2-haloacid dehalogenase 4A [Nocardioides dokdonensis FR1436]